MIYKIFKLLVVLSILFLLITGADELGMQPHKVKVGFEKQIHSGKVFFEELSTDTKEIDFIGDFLSYFLLLISMYFGEIILLFVIYIAARLLFLYFR